MTLATRKQTTARGVNETHKVYNTGKRKRKKSELDLLDSHGMHVQLGGTAKFAGNRREIKREIRPRISNELQKS